MLTEGRSGMRILFMGTPDFAAGCLEALVTAGREVVAAVSQPDRPKGRGHKVQMTPVHACAQAHGIPVYQPQAIKNGELDDVLAQTAPDVIVVVAYGKILPKEVLDYPKYGCINVHASLLPRYRGAAPIQWCIINGERETGITTMYMEQGLDTGDMILKRPLTLSEDETAGTLHDKLMRLGAQTLLETLEQIEQGCAPREKQDDSLSCYAPLLQKETAQIDWSKSAQQVRNLIRGMSPSPLAYTTYKGARMKIGQAAIADGAPSAEPGTVLRADKDGLLVQCGDGALLAQTVQFEGKKLMPVCDYLAGHTIETGVVLGREE